MRRLFEVLHYNNNGEIGPKVRFGPDFWLEGPIDLRLMRLNCILQDGIFGPSSQKLGPNRIFGRFSKCNYNIKLQSGGAYWVFGL